MVLNVQAPVPPEPAPVPPQLPVPAVPLQRMSPYDIAAAVVTNLQDQEVSQCDHLYHMNNKVKDEDLQSWLAALPILQRVFSVLDSEHVASLRTHIADYGMATWFDISQMSSSGWQACMSDWKQKVCATLLAASAKVPPALQMFPTSVHCDSLKSASEAIQRRMNV